MGIHLASPAAAVERGGTTYIASYGSSTVLAVRRGRIRTFARLPFDPISLGVGPDGTLYVSGGREIDRLDRNGQATRVAGGDATPTGGAPQAGRALGTPLGEAPRIAVGPGGEIAVADASSNVVWMMDPGGGIRPIAGTGTAGYGREGDPAKASPLDQPRSVAFGPDGSVYVADTSNRRIRRIGPDGRMTTVAGSGAVPTDTSTADRAGRDLDLDGPIDLPLAMTVIGDHLYAMTSGEVRTSVIRITIAGRDRGRIRQVFSRPIGASSGDADAALAELAYGGGLAPTSGGGLLVADTANDRILELHVD